MEKSLGVQQNTVSGRVRREPDVIIRYSPNGPTLDVLLKALLRTAALPGMGQ